MSERRSPANPKMPTVMRLLELSEAGLSDAAVAAVLKLDLGVEMAGSQVRSCRLSFGIKRTKSRVGMTKPPGHLFKEAA